MTEDQVEMLLARIESLESGQEDLRVQLVKSQKEADKYFQVAAAAWKQLDVVIPELRETQTELQRLQAKLFVQQKEIDQLRKIRDDLQERLKVLDPFGNYPEIYKHINQITQERDAALEERDTLNKVKDAALERVTELEGEVRALRQKQERAMDPDEAHRLRGIFSESHDVLTKSGIDLFAGDESVSLPDRIRWLVSHRAVAWDNEKIQRNRTREVEAELIKLRKELQNRKKDSKENIDQLLARIDELEAELASWRESLELLIGEQSPLPPIARDVVRRFFVTLLLEVPRG